MQTFFQMIATGKSMTVKGPGTYKMAIVFTQSQFKCYIRNTVGHFFRKLFLNIETSIGSGWGLQHTEGKTYEEDGVKQNENLSQA